MRTLQENQSLNAEYERNKKEREMKEEIERLQNIIKEVREYHDNCVNNLLDIDTIDENEKLAYQVAYEIHKNYLEILDKEKQDV